MAEFSGADLTVVIPTRNRFPILARTLDALKRQTVQGFDVVVVVDGTDQDPPPMDAGVIVKEHGGPGAARNVAARRSARPLILFLGDDMIPEPQTVAAHLERHNRNPAPEVGVLGRVDWHPDCNPNRIQRWMDWSGTQFDFRWIEGDEAGWTRFYSCNVSLKRDFFLDAGAFDEDFVFYYEDLDCGWRLHQKGLRLLYEPRAHTLHLHPYRWPDVERRFQGIVLGEQMMASKHDWFEPFFLNRMKKAKTRRASRAWPYLVEATPARPARVRRYAEVRANAWYYGQLADAYLRAWEGQRDLSELRAYLGAEYDETRLMKHEQEVERELEEAGDETSFYRTSRAYLYDLTAFALSGTKAPYLADLRRLVPAPSRLLDWGCGIGADGLRLLEAGYRVSFADFANPSTEYLRWRLARRGLGADVFDIESGDTPGGFDLAYSFDVIEHVEDPLAFLAELERRASVVMVNLLEPEPNDSHPHRPLPIDAILDRAEKRGLLLYRRYHGRSHLVAYAGDPAGSRPGRLRSAIERRLGPRRGAQSGSPGN